MTAKEYLQQVRFIDKRIDSKLALVSRLRDTATSVTTTLSDMPRSDSPNLQRMEDTICKIIDLENDINQEIDRLVDLKREVKSVIDALDDMDQQLILELRYLAYKPWTDIMTELGYSERSVYRIHNNALANIVVPESRQ